MEITTEAHDRMVDMGSSALLLIVAIAFRFVAEYFDVLYLLFFSGWFMRSAWAKTQKHSANAAKVMYREA